MSASARSRETGSAFAALGQDADDCAPYAPRVRGVLPEGLDGVLYRNGPGRFTRGGRTKRTVLDGDGIVQRLAIANGAATYARRFVRTPKFVAEDAADRFLSPTWTSTAPGLTTNFGQHVLSQAGVTVYQVDGRLLALDEVAPGFEVDADTLETLGNVQLGMPEADQGMKAHARCLAASGDWIFAATRLGRDGMVIEIVRHRRDGSRLNTPSVAAPRMTYVHDFAATERFAVFVLHAVSFAPLKFIVGLTSFAESLTWKPSLGNILLTVDLGTGATRCFEAPPSWCWHIANCFEQNDALVLDFVGYGDAGHFLGPNAQLAAVMQGRDGELGQPGVLRRYVANRTTGMLEECVLCPAVAEFCSTDPRTVGGKHDRIFMAVGNEAAGGLVHSGVASFDPATARLDRFDFGPDTHAGEPVFAPRPGGGENEGWLIVQLLETERQASAFAVMNAQALADGPLAVVELAQSHPLSFHGQWVARGQAAPVYAPDL